MNRSRSFTSRAWWPTPGSDGAVADGELKVMLMDEGGVLLALLLRRPFLRRAEDGVPSSSAKWRPRFAFELRRALPLALALPSCSTTSAPTVPGASFATGEGVGIVARYCSIDDGVAVCRSASDGLRAKVRVPPREDVPRSRLAVSDASLRSSAIDEPDMDAVAAASASAAAASWRAMSCVSCEMRLVGVDSTGSMKRGGAMRFSGDAEGGRPIA